MHSLYKSYSSRDYNIEILKYTILIVKIIKVQESTCILLCLQDYVFHFTFCNVIFLLEQSIYGIPRGESVKLSSMLSYVLILLRSTALHE